MFKGVVEIRVVVETPSSPVNTRQEEEEVEEKREGGLKTKHNRHQHVSFLYSRGNQITAIMIEI